MLFLSVFPDPVKVIQSGISLQTLFTPPEDITYAQYQCACVHLNRLGIEIPEEARVEDINQLPGMETPAKLIRFPTSPPRRFSTESPSTAVEERRREKGKGKETEATTAEKRRQEKGKGRETQA
jgi:hypothetical protein